MKSRLQWTLALFGMFLFGVWGGANWGSDSAIKFCAKQIYECESMVQQCIQAYQEDCETPKTNETPAVLEF